MAETLLLFAAFACTVSGLAFCALAMEGHFKQVSGHARIAADAVRKLRVRAAVALVGSMVLCLAADHVSIAALVWVMMLSLSAVLLALIFAYRPRSLRFLLVRIA